MHVLVDIGGSGARFAACQHGSIGTPRAYRDIRDVDRLITVIRQTADGGHITGLALSVPGYVNAETGTVRRSANASYLEGGLADRLKKAFPLARVRVVNDGEAHARALLRQKGLRLGAINLALGTAIAFGALDIHGNTVYPMNGENWDISDFPMNTRAPHKEVSWALGAAGLRQLEEDHRQNGGDSAYLRYGWRLGTLLTVLSGIFRPNTIGLSGGILRAHANEISRGVNESFSGPGCMDKPRIVLMTDEKSVMTGLSTLL